MTNSAFTKLLQSTAKSYNRYRRKLILAHAEYQRRYGSLPGDIDDDHWIDSLEGGTGEADEHITAELIEKYKP